MPHHLRLAPPLAGSLLLLTMVLLSACASDAGDAPPTAGAGDSTSPPATAVPSPAAASPSVPPTDASVPPLSAAGRLPVVHMVSGMDQVRVERDRAYAPDRSPHHLLDVYAPPSGEGLPAVVLVHGSVPANARLKETPAYDSWGRLLAASGLVAVTLNWDEPSTADLADALAYVRTNAAALHLDPDNICLMAFSGGVGAALPWVLTGEAGALRCVVAYYGDLRPASAALGTADLAGAPPFFIARGEQDEMIPDDGAAAFAEQAQARGLSVQLVSHPTGVHAFDLRNDDDTTRAIIDQTIAFLTR